MKVPYTNFKTRTGDDTAIGGCGFIGGEWKDKDTVEIFDNKKIVLFALPGAPRPPCDSLLAPPGTIISGRKVLLLDMFFPYSRAAAIRSGK